MTLMDGSRLRAIGMAPSRRHARNAGVKYMMTYQMLHQERTRFFREKP